MLYGPGRLRILRLGAGHAQRQIGDWIGVLASTIGRYERGEAPIPPEHQEQLAELFGVSFPG